MTGKGSLIPAALLIFFSLLLLPLLTSSQGPDVGPDVGPGGGNAGPDVGGNAGPDVGPGGGAGGGAAQEPPRPVGPQDPLKVGFYQQSCPQAEKIVNDVLLERYKKDPLLAPGFVRLLFHDCFVMGCDGSVLLDQTSSQQDVEKTAAHNGPDVKGFDVVDEIKTRLETECPGIVSCSDILAFAARDSLVFTGVPRYDVPAGRRDSRTSLASNVPPNLPLPQTPPQEIIQMYAKKGLTVEEMVLLNGAHSIGGAKCTAVADRFRDPAKAADIPRGYLLRMLAFTICTAPQQTVAFDPLSPNLMDSRYYTEVLERRALLESDATLAKLPEVADAMKKYVNNQEEWIKKFVEAMIKLGNIEVLTGKNGEVRKKCRFLN